MSYNMTVSEKEQKNVYSTIKEHIKIGNQRHATEIIKKMKENSIEINYNELLRIVLESSDINNIIWLNNVNKKCCFPYYGLLFKNEKIDGNIPYLWILAEYSDNKEKLELVKKFMSYQTIEDAAKYGKIKAIKFLISNGCPKHRLNKMDNNIIQLMLTYGSEIYYSSAYQLAIKHGHIETAKYLLENGFIDYDEE